jgi:hypothetical protein
LLQRTGSVLDVAYALDLKAARAAPLAADAAALERLAASIAGNFGVTSLQVLASPTLRSNCVAATSSPPTIVLGQALVESPHAVARTFLLTRAIKLIASHAAAVARMSAKELPSVIAAWLQTFSPQWQPPGLPPAQLQEQGRRIRQARPPQGDPDVSLMALEVAGTFGSQTELLGAATIAWANRVALLAVGDPNAALDGIALSLGNAAGAPPTPQERAAWIARTPEARDLLGFSVSEAYSEARAKCLNP